MPRAVCEADWPQDPLVLFRLHGPRSGLPGAWFGLTYLAVTGYLRTNLFRLSAKLWMTVCDNTVGLCS